MDGLNSDLPIPLSAVEHYAYCRRQAGLVLVEGLWLDNAATVRGKRAHRRVDDAREGRVERGRRVLRAVPLWSDRYGLVGRADAVEVYPDGTVVPVEYKGGQPHLDLTAVQLCAQAFCLEEMLGVPVPRGVVWAAAPRRRYDVTLDGPLRERTAAIIADLHRMVAEGRTPPAQWGPRCQACQLAPLCLPDLISNPQRVTRRIREELFGCGT